MGLIKCYECGSQVSSAAAACPKCGAPVAQSGASVGAPLMTTQLTSKGLKIQAVISAVIFWIALIWYIFALAIDENGIKISTTAFTFFGVLLIGSIIWHLITKIRIWWHHK